MNRPESVSDRVKCNARIILSCLAVSCPATAAMEVIRQEIPHLPLRFASLQDRDFDWRQGMVFSLGSGVFASEEVWREYRKAEKLFLRGTTSAVMFASKNLEGKVVPPIALQTSDDYSGALSFKINTTQMPPDARNMRRVMSDFNYLDLIAVAPNEHFYTFIAICDSAGTLVLPYPGVDFDRIPSLPRRIEKLVVYNSLIGEEFARRVSECEELSELVLVNCFGSKDLFGYERESEIVTILQPTRQRLERLTVINGTLQLPGWFSSGDLPRLKEVSLTPPAIFLPAARSEGSPPLPDYPLLRKATVYYPLPLYENEECLEQTISNVNSHFDDLLESREGSVISHMIVVDQESVR